MLSRYTMYRGPRPPHDPMPEGIRQDSRKHTNHCLRPSAESVAAYLSAPTETAWRRFKKDYLAALEERILQDSEPFDRLAALATDKDVFVGCSCPTRKNEVWGRCHTFLALRFMNKKYPRLEVVIPEAPPVVPRRSSVEKKRGPSE